MTPILLRFWLPALSAALLCTTSNAQVPTPKDYQVQLDCASPRNQALLNAPLHSDPHENVWVLEVLDAMGLNRHCPELREDLLANYLERQAANDIVKEPIGQPATVRDALEWERKAEFDNTPADVAHDRGHIHSRLLTRAFALEAWAPVATEIERLRDAPRLAPVAPGLWVDATQPDASPLSLKLVLSFVNTSGREVDWDAHTLRARSTPDGKYDLMFSCTRDGRNGPPVAINRATAAPGGRVNVVCQLANTGLPLKLLDASWMERLKSGEQQWFLEGPPSDGGTYDYRDTLRRFATPGSHATAAPYLGSLTCNQSLGCLSAKVAWLQSPLYLWLRDAGPASLAGIALTWCLSLGRRDRMAHVATRLVVVIVLLFGVAIGFLMLGGLGMGAIGLSLYAWRAAVGAIAGVLVMRIWARKSSQT